MLDPIGYLTTSFNWPYLLAAVGIWGLILAGQKNKAGWAVGLFAQVLWIVYALVTKQYAFIASALAYGFVYARNFLRWRKESKEIEDGQG